LGQRSRRPVELGGVERPAGHHTVTSSGLILSITALLLTTAQGPELAAQLVADFTATPSTGPVVLTVAFSDTTTGGTPLLWAWDFGDGGTSTKKNPNHSYLSPGSYTVSLSVSGGVGQFDSETKVDFVTVTAPALVVDFSATPLQGVNPLQVSFSDDSTGATGTAWVWDFGDGTTSNLQHPDHTYMAPGSYDVSLAVSLPGQTGSLLQQDFITVMSAPIVVDFTARPTQGVNPLAVSFNDTSTGATITSWLWNFGDGATSTQQNPTHVYTAPGTHSVQLQTSVGQQLNSITKSDLITVEPSPLAPDFAATPTMGMNPVTVSFTDTTTGTTPTAWSWNFGDGSSSTQQNPVHIYTAPGSHDVTLTAFVGQQNASVTQLDLITVQPAPLVVDFDVSPAQGVSPLLVSFFDASTGTPGTAWLWDFGDGSTSQGPDPTHLYNVADTTSFTVSLTVFVGQQSDTLVLAEAITVQQGPFGPAQVITAAADGTETTHAADLDGDGDIDVFAASGMEFKGGATIGRIEWYPNMDGLGTFGAPRPVTAAGDLPESLDAADVDGDGDLDILFASELKLAWYENTSGAGAFTQRLITTAGDFRSIDAVDLDGDGDADALYASSFVDTVAWFENRDGLGSFSVQHGITTEAAFPRAVRGADLDGDGDFDVLTASSNDSTVAWFENTNGQGLFGSKQFVSTSTSFANSVDAADLDGDGDLDALASGTGQAQIAWHENTDGLGSFGPGQVVTTEVVSASHIHAVDLDGDGDVDVLSSSYGDDTIAWYENTYGLGGFGPENLITTAANGANQVFAADLDGDGDADVISAADFGDNVAWYANTLASPAWPFLGDGLAGSNGLPVLEGDGVLAPTSVVTLTLSNALPSSATALVIGLTSLGASFKGGVLVPTPDLVIPGLPVDPGGGLVLSGVWPGGIPGGVTIWFQHWINDLTAPQGLSASNGLSGTTTR